MALVACSTPPAPESESRPIVGPDGAGLFGGAGSPWFQRVPAGASVDPRSAEYVARMLAEIPLVSVNGWTVPVYEADSATPRYPVTATEDYVPGGWTLPAVPIPDAAAPDPKEDGHMVVVDRSAGCVYEFWQARRLGAGWTASWVNATPADGTGVYPDGLSARASGFSAAAGLIWPQELAAGRINHALVFAYPFSRDSGPVPPATKSDGRSDGAALPMGTRLRLDPSIDVESLGLAPEQVTIARAMQEYGLILADSGGGFTLFAAAPQSYATFPYPSSWTRDTWANISAIPFNALQVLQPTEPVDRYSGPQVTNRCAAT